MKLERKNHWEILLNSWNNDTPACMHELALEYTKRFPDDFCGWIVLADALTHFALYKRARAALSTALSLAPTEKKTDVYHQIGHHYSEKGDHKRAELWYRKALEENRCVEHYIFLGACLAKQGRLEKAKKYHLQAIKTKSKEVDEAYFNLGLIYRAERNFKKASEYFGKAIELDPEYKLAKIAKEDINKIEDHLKKIKQDREN